MSDRVISYSVGVEDIEAFVEHELRTTYRRRIFLQGAFTALVVATLSYFFLYAQLHHVVASLSVAGLFGLLLLCALPGVTRDQQRRGIRKLFRNAQDTALGPHSLTIKPEGLASESASGSGLVLWPAFQRLSHTRDHVFLLLGPATAIIIPLRDLQEPVRTQLLPELAAHVGAGAV
jgi:hypothetical protein